MPTTIRDVAKALNVSHTTVSRVLNGRGGSFISDETRRRVEATAREMNYQPNRAARALATGRNHAIGLWIADVFHPYFTRVMHYAGEQIERQGYDMAIYKAPARGRSSHQSPAHWPVDGVLALDDPDRIERYLKETPEEGRAPLVSMGVYYCGSADHVGIDLYDASREAVGHLLASGRERVAFLSATRGLLPGDARYDGYHDAVRAAGREPEVIPTANSFRADSRQVIRDYVAERGTPDALFCFCDDMALGAYRGLCDLGLRVPDDVALVGCDGIEDTEYLETPLSTIEQPLPEMCRLAWEMLERRLADPALPPQGHVLRARFVPRDSSGPPGPLAA